MTRLAWLALVAALVAVPPAAESCCPAGPSGKQVVNADQTVILLWDAATKTEHFIRRATFKSDADDFGFLIPSPSKPELAESGNEAFPTLQKLTEPEVIVRERPHGGGCGCDDKKGTAKPGSAAGFKQDVTVLDRKLVAGFDAAVLEATSTQALVDWLKDHGYAYSPEIAAWAKPYVEGGWKVTALKVAKKADDKADKTVAASALRLSFQTDRPLFPYRESDPTSAAQTLGASHRLLRIYFLSNEKVRGEMKGAAWTGKVAWAGRVSPGDRSKLLDQLRLPATTGPNEWWLTEFEDDWPYRAAPADVYFDRNPDQREVKRDPIIRYVAVPRPPDGSAYLLAGAVALTALVGRLRRWRA
jgi:hypothetical protein